MRTQTTLARHPSGVEGGILVTVEGGSSPSAPDAWRGGAGGDGGSDGGADGSDGSDSDLTRQRVFLTATVEDQ